MRPPFDQSLLTRLCRKNRNIYAIVIYDYGRDQKKLIGNPELWEETIIDDDVARDFPDAGGSDLRRQFFDAGERVRCSEDRTTQIVRVAIMKSVIATYRCRCPDRPSSGLPLQPESNHPSNSRKHRLPRDEIRAF